MRRLKNVVTIAMALSTSFMMACGGGSGGGALGEGHDFGSNDPNLISSVGDSITAGHGATPYPSHLSGMVGKNTINNGIEGARSDEIADRASHILASQHPGYLTIMAGTNDIGDGHTIEFVIANLSRMIDAAKSNKTIPVLLTVTPGYPPHGDQDGAYQNLNGAIRSLAGSKGVRLVETYGLIKPEDVQADGLHPNNSGQLKIATAVANVF